MPFKFLYIIRFSGGGGKSGKRKKLFFYFLIIVILPVRLDNVLRAEARYELARYYRRKPACANDFIV